MEVFLKITAVAVTGSVVGLCIKKELPQLAIMIGIAAGVIILIPAVQSVEEIAAQVSAIISSAGIDIGIFEPLAKLLGISAVTRITSGICKDAGNSALAAKLEIASAVVSVVVIMPLIESVLKMISALCGQI